MPDTRYPLPGSRPEALLNDWGDAFNAMPAQAPPSDAWPALAQRIDARRRHRALPAWLGLAAAAAVVAVIAWPALEVAPPPVEATQVATAPSPVESPQVATAPSPVEPPQVATASPVGATQVATSPIAEDSVAARAAPTTRVVAPPDRLLELQAESARLESLLAVVRDPDVGSASALLMADAIDAQVAGIDAALGNPGLEPGERERLWQARVDALQQAAGFESTQRLLASGGHSDALLVAVD